LLLRFPADQGTLFISCPHCNYKFRFDPLDTSSIQKGFYEQTNPDSIPNSWKDYLWMPWDFLHSLFQHFRPNSSFSIKRWIEILLFAFLGLYLFRGCNDIPEKIESPPPLFQEEPTPSNPDQNWEEPPISTPPSVEV
jgi:hypothetical protein